MLHSLVNCKYTKKEKKEGNPVVGKRDGVGIRKAAMEVCMMVVRRAICWK
jgi:hypothetical protein